MAGPETPPAPPYVPIPSNKIFPRWERAVAIGWSLVAVGLLVAGYTLWRSHPPQPQAGYPTPVQVTWDAGLAVDPALSENGKILVYASYRSELGKSALRVRNVATGEVLPVTGGESNDTQPDLSPDGRQIVFRSEQPDGGVYIMPAGRSGAPRLLAKGGWRPRFSPNGRFVTFFTAGGSAGQDTLHGSGQGFVAAVDTGEVRQMQPHFRAVRYPIWVSDGQHLLFEGTRSDGVNDWWVTRIDGGEAIRMHAFEAVEAAGLLPGVPERWYRNTVLFSAAADGRLHIWSLPVSPSAWRVSGPPRQLTSGEGRDGRCTVSAKGRLIYTRTKRVEEVWSLPLDPELGQVAAGLQPLTHDHGIARLPSLAKDGARMIYLSDRTGYQDVWFRDLGAGTAYALTRFRPIGYRPILSADGRRVVFPAEVDGRCVLSVLEMTWPGKETAIEGCFGLWDWSPDGSALLIFDPSASRMSIGVFNLVKNTRQTKLSYPKYTLFGARFSPDGRWIAFGAGTKGSEGRLLVAPLRSGAVREDEWTAIAPNTAGHPAWSPDGTTLYFDSLRDGFHCLWAQKLDSRKRPQGEPVAMQHFHSAAFGFLQLNGLDQHVAAAGNRLVFSLVKDAGNLWAIQLNE